MLIPLFVSVCYLCIVAAEATGLARLFAQEGAADCRRTDCIQRRRTRGLVLFLGILALVAATHATRAYGLLRGSEGSTRAMEPWIDSFQRSLVLYMPVMVVPLISSGRFRTLHVEEHASATFIEWCALARLAVHPTISAAFGHRSLLGMYLADVLGLSETVLQISIFSLAMAKVLRLLHILGHTELITRYEIESVVRGVVPGIVGFLLYLGLDLVLKVFSIALMMQRDAAPDTDIVSVGRLVLFVLLCRCAMVFLSMPAREVGESIQKMEDIKKHVAGSFLNLQKTEQSAAPTI